MTHGRAQPGALARDAGVNPETIRYYERRGLLPEPPRRLRRRLHLPGPPGTDPEGETPMTDLHATALVADLTDVTFDDAGLASETPVLVDFWATWCGPCTLVEPILAELVAERRGELVVARVDVDANPDVTRRYGVMSMPTLLVFRDGEPVHRMVGARGKRHLVAELDLVL